jgi:hypothetical protein
MPRRVRAGQVYVYVPVLYDQCDPRLSHIESRLFVRVVNLRGCPPANTMGHCHIKGAVTNDFLGLVCTKSLRPLTPAQRRRLIRQGTIRT